MKSPGQVYLICKYSTTAQAASLSFSRSVSVPHTRHPARVLFVLFLDTRPSHRYNDTVFSAYSILPKLHLGKLKQRCCSELSIL